MYNFKDKTILITGATSGIGYKLTNDLLNFGAKIIVITRNLEKTIALFNANPKSKDIAFIKCDLSDLADIESVFSAENLNKIDGFVHSAGIVKLLPLGYFDRSSIEEINNINYNSAVLISAILFKKRLVNREASFIFISSIMSNVGLAGNSIYAGSKGALVSFAKSLALEVAKKRIRVNCISPGLVLTPLTENAHSPAEIQNYDESNPLGIGKTTDIAELLMFLLSNKSGWITGTNIVIDGGYSAK